MAALNHVTDDDYRLLRGEGVRGSPEDALHRLAPSCRQSEDKQTLPRKPPPEEQQLGAAANIRRLGAFEATRDDAL
ncbi:hypothetical protein E2C01_007452 [Portunus trituberculatus]|uniref:Uncharacterized protein n=1 Tax=Portunus trituberculatus TaxID=210409 RepID=A0A5B7D0J3_PORTR|nr:hypothetical protein [Portunus trituberculatus]